LPRVAAKSTVAASTTLSAGPAGLFVIAVAAVTTLGAWSAFSARPTRLCAFQL